MSLALQPSAVLAARRNLTVCVVDGDPAQMALVGDSLGRAGFPGVGAVSSQEALEKVRVGRFQVILADCNLSGMDGLAFLERALQQGPGIHLILMSADHSVDSAIEAIKHGAYDYLCKPLDYPRLTKALDDLTQQLRKLQSAAITSHADWRPFPAK
jgi:DNA-binding NtrC family response regulator